MLNEWDSYSFTLRCLARANGGDPLPGSGGATGTGGDTDTGTACVPGMQVSCACPGSTSAHGVQICNTQGTGYASCSGCPDAGTTPARSPSSTGCGCALGSPTNTGIPIPRWTALALLAALIHRRRR